MIDPLIVVDATGKIALVNAAVSDVLGYAADELLGQPLEKVLRDADGQVGQTATVISDILQVGSINGRRSFWSHRHPWPPFWPQPQHK